MAGGLFPVHGTADLSRVESPVSAKAYLICAFAAFGGIFFGYDIGWMSGVLGMPYFVSMYTGLQYDYDAKLPVDPNANFSLSSHEKSLMTSILSLGTFLGALVAGDVADWIGRRPTIIVGCAVFCAGCILQVSGTNQLALMVMGRLIAGIGVGFNSAVVILYMSEIAPRKIRGALVAGYQLCIYCVKKNQVDHARAALSRVRGQPATSDYIRDELAEIVANHEYESRMMPEQGYCRSWLACFQGSLSKPSSNIRRTILGMGVQMAAQMAGVNFIFYFGTTFFQQLKTLDNPFFISLITSLVNVISTPISFWTIEKFGRRPLLIYGAIGMTVMQSIIAILGITVGRAEEFNVGAVRAMIAIICLDIFVFAATWGPCAWVIIGEAFPLTIRSRGVGLSTASCWLWNLIIATITPYLVGADKGSADLGPKVFFIWGSFCCFLLAFSYFLVPEMKGLSLEQVDQMLEETTPRKSSGWVPKITFAAEVGAAEKTTVSTHEETMDRPKDV
ncbi:hypothetical protein K4F52_006354 [Lecanicillium sp. MT-2017a]|nr:hypothetical protein K4F52_006354 [Lecanicillium sp. MT-2017a]